MSKAWAYLSMLAIVAALAAADALILVRSGALSRYARNEIDRMSDGAVRAREVTVSLDGVISLEGVEVSAGPKHPRVLDAARAELGLRGTTVERILLRDARLRLSDSLFEELSSRDGPSRSVRDVFPDPRALPRFELEGGTVEADLSAVFGPGRPQAVAIRRAAAVPLSAWRVHLEAELESPLLGTISARGEAALDTGELRVQVEARGVEFRPPLRDAFGPAARHVFDKYRPGGRADLRVVLERRPREPLDFVATLIARSMSIVYGNFPYPLERVEGEIDFFRRGFRIKDCAGRHGPATVRMSGWGEDYPEDSAYALRFEIENLPLDGALRSAVPPASQVVWDRFRPAGRAHVRGRAYRESGPDRPARVPIDVTVEGAELTFEGFPYPVKGLHGELGFQGDDVEVRGLRFEDQGAKMTVTGSIRELSGDAEVSLVFDGEAFPLDARLRDALPPEALKRWKEFSPEGAVDVRWVLKKAKGAEPTHSARARARGNAAIWERLPLRATGIEGEIELDGGRVVLNHLSGTVNGARAEVHGSVTDELSLLRLDVTGLPIDADLTRALPPEPRRVLEDFKLAGTATMTSTLKLRKGGDNLVDVVLRLTRGSVDTEPRFEDLEGTVALTGFFGEEATLMGSLAFSRATIHGKRFTDVASSFNMKGPRINFVNLKATAYGGLVAGDAFSLDTRSGDFAGERFTVDRVELAEFAKDTSGFKQKALSGKVSIELENLKGRSGDAGTVTGKGRARVQDALLWDVPVFVSFFQLNPQDLFKSKNSFEAGALDFEIARRRFLVERLAFTSETASIVGRGSVDFDGAIKFYLKPQSGRLLGIDFFILNWASSFLSFFTGGIMGVEVGGSFEKPETVLRPFQGF
jgi:hypothetical protein